MELSLSMTPGGNLQFRSRIEKKGIDKGGGVDLWGKQGEKKGRKKRKER